MVVYKLSTWDEYRYSTYFDWIIRCESSEAHIVHKLIYECLYKYKGGGQTLVHKDYLYQCDREKGQYLSFVCEASTRG